jgi:phosphate transport system protein
MKINAELERIADLAVDICQRVLGLSDKPLLILTPLVILPKLADVAQGMIRDAIDAFVKKDAALARKVMAADSEADDLRNKACDKLINEYMSKDSSTAERAIQYLLVARHLERVCDHATNIAEDVIYMVEGNVVRHKRD